MALLKTGQKGGGDGGGDASAERLPGQGMDAKTFNSFRALVYERSGITLKPGKEALVSARVGKRMRALGIATHEAYLQFLTEDETEEEFVHFIDAVSTNVTSFFRESQHFEYIQGVVEEWLRKGVRRLRFWSAASSTGEEPYSLAITLNECEGAGRADIRILATDISTRVLQACTEGVYNEEKLRNVSYPIRDRYFTSLALAGGERAYRVTPELQRMIVFRRLNLSSPPFPMKGPLDVVFCRNVMIYFDNAVRGRLLDEINRLLKPGGYLVVGHAESLTGMMSDFHVVKPSVYRKTG